MSEKQEILNKNQLPKWLKYTFYALLILSIITLSILAATGVFNITINSNSTTSVPSTTKVIETTREPSTTSTLTTTIEPQKTLRPIFVNPTVLVYPINDKFSEGESGRQGALGTDIDYPYNGGGGAGGIMIKGYNPPTSEPPDYLKISCGDGGSNGIGFGAGGGGCGYSCVLISGEKYQKGGSGSQGFVYLADYDIVFTDCNKDISFMPREIKPSKNVYTFILMGGGGAGQTSNSINSGGCSGNIYTGSIRNLKDTDIITITVGKGGIPWPYNNQMNGYPSIVSVNGIEKLKAVGGYQGGHMREPDPSIDISLKSRYIYCTPQSTIKNSFENITTNSSSAIGGYSGDQDGYSGRATRGNKIDINLINEMNNFEIAVPEIVTTSPPTTAYIRPTIIPITEPPIIEGIFEYANGGNAGEDFKDSSENSIYNNSIDSSKYYPYINYSKFRGGGGGGGIIINAGKLSCGINIVETKYENGLKNEITVAHGIIDPEIEIDPVIDENTQKLIDSIKKIYVQKSNSGYRGFGFGAGGGGGYFCEKKYTDYYNSLDEKWYFTGSSGYQGFVYIVEENMLFIKTGERPHIVFAGKDIFRDIGDDTRKCTIILMGGGGAGNPSGCVNGYETQNCIITDTNSGGSSGNIRKITLDIDKNSVLLIKVGVGRNYDYENRDNIEDATTTVKHVIFQSDKNSESSSASQSSASQSSASQSSAEQSSAPNLLYSLNNLYGSNNPIEIIYKATAGNSGGFFEGTLYPQRSIEDVFDNSSSKYSEVYNSSSALGGTRPKVDVNNSGFISNSNGSVISTKLLNQMNQVSYKCSDNSNQIRITTTPFSYY
jgi:hypothetical protein